MNFVHINFRLVLEWFLIHVLGSMHWTGCFWKQHWLCLLRAISQKSPSFHVLNVCYFFIQALGSNRSKPSEITYIGVSLTHTCFWRQLYNSRQFWMSIDGIERPRGRSCAFDMWMDRSASSIWARDQNTPTRSFNVTSKKEQEEENISRLEHLTQTTTHAYAHSMSFSS